jgi:hypothetical protein
MDKSETVSNIQKYKFIHFVRIGFTPKTTIWSCRNNKSGAELALVKWYAPWRQYCFMPSADIVFSKGCIEDILHFMDWL